MILKALSVSGPSNWASVSATCGGSSQSPINIEVNNAQFDSNLKSFDLQKFGSSNGLASSYMKNNGHTGKESLLFAYISDVICRGWKKCEKVPVNFSISPHSTRFLTSFSICNIFSYLTRAMLKNISRVHRRPA